MNEQEKVFCKILYDKNARLIYLHFSEELKIVNVFKEKTFSEKNCKCDAVIMPEDPLEESFQSIAIFILDAEGVDSMLEIKRYSVIIEVGLFFDPIDVALKTIERISALVFCGKEVIAASEEVEQKIKKTKKDKKAKTKKDKIKSRK